MSRRFAAALLGVLAVACGKPSSFPQEEKTLLTARAGGAELHVALLRWGTHVPFGAGPGRAGFLDPSHDHLVMRGYVTDPTTKLYAPQFERHWDTNGDPNAVARWNEAWSKATVERCDAGGSVAFAIRGPAIVDDKWIVLTVIDGRIANEPRDESAPDCATLRERLP